MRKLVFVVLLSVAFISCQKSSDKKLLPGETWIEASQGKDTITFINVDPDLMFSLKREGLISNGVLMPKSGVGPYVCTLLKDTIAIRPAVSNSLFFNHFYFNLDAETNQLSIGNFYDDTKIRGTVLTFTKKP